MTPDVLFSIANPVALLGWVLLLLSPIAPRYLLPVAGYVIPGILSLGYVVLIFVYWAGGEGGFDTLANVMLLFEDPGLALAGWVHFLAFDLLVGGAIVRDARAQGINHFLIIPALVLTFLFGPAGLVVYLVIRATRSTFFQKETPA